MNTIPTEAGPFEISGTTPNAAELEAINNLLIEHRGKTKNEEMKATDREVTDWSNTPIPSTPAGPRQTLRPRGADVLEATGQPLPTAPGKPPTRPLEYPDAPTTASIDLPVASVNAPEGKRVPFGDAMALRFGPLATDSPKARQEIYVKNLPGAKARDDKYGNPMVEYEGKLYYTARPGEIDAMDVSRTALGVAATLPAALAAPVSIPGLLAVGAGTGIAQSVGEDLVAKASGAESLPWVNVEKALWSGGLGAALPAILKSTPVVAGRLNELIQRGQPLTDDALRAAGLTTQQIETLTPELRDNITKVARRTVLGADKNTAAGATYREGLVKEFAPGTKLTMGELSGDPAQIAAEQTLAGKSDVPGRAQASNIIRANRAEQDVGLNAAQERLRGGVGTGVAMDPTSAGNILKGKAKDADKLAKEATDLLYDKTRNPFLMTQDGIPVAAPKEAVSGVGKVVRAGVEANEKVSNVLTKEGAELAPQAAGAIKQLDEFSARSAPRPGPTMERAAELERQIAESRAGRPPGLLTEPTQTPEAPAMVSSPEVNVYRPQGLLAGEELPPGASVNRTAIDQPGVRVTAPAQPPSAESMLSAGVNTPPPGGPRITGPSPTGKSNVPGDVDWSTVISQRKLLTDRMEAAANAGNKTDMAAMKEIIDSFDNHFGPTNPNLAPARQAHADRMERFMPGGSPSQDRMTEAALEVLQGPEGGAKVVNTIFGPGLKKGEATQMIEHLNTRVFNDHPEARAVLKEQALRRLVVDADGNALSPTKAVNEIEKAFGEQQGGIYKELFTDEELARLRRFQELQRVFANSRDKINPPGSGLIAQAVLQAKSAANVGAVVGGGVGGLLGLPAGGGGAAAGTAIGGGIGYRAGAALDAARPPYAAARAINPPPGYTGAAPSPLPGYVGIPGTATARDQAMPPGPGGGGPADRIMEGLQRSLLGR